MKNNNKQLQIARQKVNKLNFDIKIIQAERNKENILTFYFESENRIDFRELVKELNETFNETIRLEQIGSRDCAKQIGGIGKCGRNLCCKKFLPKFNSITYNMISAQGLRSSPSQCTGLCGKLMCCLYFECPKDKLEEIKKKKSQKKAKLAKKKTIKQEEKIKKQLLENPKPPSKPQSQSSKPQIQITKEKAKPIEVSKKNIKTNISKKEFKKKKKRKKAQQIIRIINKKK